jgi:choline/glycine/proline betaine transport protein
MQTAKSGFFAGVNKPITILSMLLVIAAVIFGITVLGQDGNGISEYLRNNVLASLNSYYIPVVASFLIFIVLLVVSPFGKIRLGDDDDEPEFTNFSWIAMLFSCGMGIGLVFFAVAEPIFHYQGNIFMPPELALTAEGQQTAMLITFLHWGLHPWTTYVIVALCLAYFSYRKKMPLSFRSVLQPIFGKAVNGLLGGFVDLIVVFVTVVGVAASLGLGAQQLNTGLNHLFGLPVSTTMQIILVTVITVIATASVATGLARGIRYLSLVNVLLSMVILTLIFILASPLDLISDYGKNVWLYVKQVIPMSFKVDDSGWQAGWTSFYWAWWISWAPFVGMFIARISRGRTIRQLVLGALVIPTALTFVWLTIFGNTGLNVESNIGGLATAVSDDVTMAVYSMFDLMNVGSISVVLASLASILIFTYFVTSADSATLVVATILSNGNLNPPILQRIIWGLGTGVMAVAILLGGGLSAVQTASLTISLPFSIIMILMMIALCKALLQEK